MCLPASQQNRAPKLAVVAEHWAAHHTPPRVSEAWRRFRVPAVQTHTSRFDHRAGRKRRRVLYVGGSRHRSIDCVWAVVFRSIDRLRPVHLQRVCVRASCRVDTSFGPLPVPHTTHTKTNSRAHGARTRDSSSCSTGAVGVVLTTPLLAWSNQPNPLDPKQHTGQEGAAATGVGEARDDGTDLDRSLLGRPLTPTEQQQHGRRRCKHARAAEEGG